MFLAGLVPMEGRSLVCSQPHPPPLLGEQAKEAVDRPLGGLLQLHALTERRDGKDVRVLDLSHDVSVAVKEKRKCHEHGRTRNH